MDASLAASSRREYRSAGNAAHVADDSNRALASRSSARLTKSVQASGSFSRSMPSSAQTLLEICSVLVLPSHFCQTAAVVLLRQNAL
jgi:hypothetical protein